MTTMGLQTTLLSVPAAGIVQGNMQPFTTTGFLDAFECDPTKGTIVLPRVGGVGDGTMGADPLTDDRVGEMESIVDAVVSEAQGLRADLSKWNLKLPHPLPATDGRWTLHSKDRCEDGFVFKSASSGRHVSFWNFKSSMAVGRSGRYASYHQRVYIELGGDGIKRVCTESYWMAFLREGVSALANYLNLKGDSVPEVALAVANLVYASGQLSPQQLTHPMQVYYDRQRHDMVLDGEQWILPDSPMPLEKHVSFELAHEELYQYGSIPLNVQSGHDRIMIGVHRLKKGSQYFVPLSPDLLSLWEGARLLVDADPVDDDYMVRFI